MPCETERHSILRLTKGSRFIATMPIGFVVVVNVRRLNADKLSWFDVGVVTDRFTMFFYIFGITNEKSLRAGIVWQLNLVVKMQN